jgi:hypothetical protein
VVIAANVAKINWFYKTVKGKKQDFHFFLFFLGDFQSGVSVILIGYRNLLLPITNSL